MSSGNGERATRATPSRPACERSCRKQRDLLRQLEDLAASEREMFELDHAKDQVMTACKLALANLVMWARDHSFPATYTQASLSPPRTVFLGARPSGLGNSNRRGGTLPIH
jgi:hypothetical protein